MKKVETEKEKELLETLEDVINQACGRSRGDCIDSMALTAYAGAMRLLAKYGRIKIINDVGRRVIGEWVK